MNILERSDKHFDIKPTTTVGELKKFLRDNNYDIPSTILTFTNGQQLAPIVFQTNQYDGVNFQQYANYLKGSSLVVVTKRKQEENLPTSGTQYGDLPADMKRMMIETVDPAEAVVLLKTVPYNNWKRLLDLNYDFVTQGFAVGNTDEEKFKYLAARVSKNINNRPDIVFLHFEGKPMGERRFVEFDKYLGSIPDVDFELDYRGSRDVWNGIVNGLKQSPAVEWVRYDNDNAWIKVLNPDELPTSFAVSSSSPDRRMQRIIRDGDYYDYPETRRNKLRIENGQEYPGVYNPNQKELSFQPYNFEGYENFDDLVMDVLLNINHTTREYGVYGFMTFNMNRTDAEIVVKVLTEAGVIGMWMESYQEYLAR